MAEMHPPTAQGEHRRGLEQFDWDDPSIYQWNLSLGRRDVVGLVFFWIGAAVVAPAIICGVLWVLSLLSRGIAYWVGALGTGLMLIVVFSNIYLSIMGKPRERLEARKAVNAAAIVALGGMLYVLAAPRSPLAAGFRGADGAGFGGWALFLLENASIMIIFNIPEIIFRIDISKIDYNSNLSRVITLLVRVLITIGTFELLLQLIRTRGKQHRLFATVEECFRYCAALPDAKGMVLKCEGIIAPSADVAECQVSEFITHFQGASRGEVAGPGDASAGGLRSPRAEPGRDGPGGAEGGATIMDDARVEEEKGDRLL